MSLRVGGPRLSPPATPRGKHRCPQGAARARAQPVHARECREGTATLSSLPSRSRASYLQLQATLRAPIIFQPRHSSFPWHPAAPAGAETRRKGVEGAGSFPRSGVFPWPDPPGGIQGGRYRRPWRWRGWLGELSLSAQLRADPEGGGGGTSGATWKAQIPELQMSLRPTLHPRPHLPPPLRNKWICRLVKVPLKLLFLKSSQPRKIALSPSSQLPWTLPSSVSSLCASLSWKKSSNSRG